MGTVEFLSNQSLLFKANIITYGNEANELLTELIRKEIEFMWNEPEGLVNFQNQFYRIYFEIKASYRPKLTESDVLMNYNPENNFFRIENYVQGNISFVDDIGCNTGYFLKENLYEGYEEFS